MGSVFQTRDVKCLWQRPSSLSVSAWGAAQTVFEGGVLSLFSDLCCDLLCFVVDFPSCGDDR